MRGLLLGAVCATLVAVGAWMLAGAGPAAPGRSLRAPVIGHASGGFIRYRGTVTNPQVGDIISVSRGNWSNIVSSYAYRWQDCAGVSPITGYGTGCSNVAGANSSSYTVAAGDVGSYLGAVVTATFIGGGAASQPSIATGVVASSSSGPVCSPSACTDPSRDQTFSVTASDGAGGTLTWTFNLYRPGNLLNDPGHPVPLVFAGIDQASGQGNSCSPCIYGATWIGEAKSDKYVYVEMDPISSEPSYAMPSMNRSPTGAGARTCGPGAVNGSGGTSICDDVPIIQAALAAMECNGAFPCQNIDTSRVYFTGSSKGAVIPEGLMCDQRTTTLSRGYGIDSNAFISPGTTASTRPNCAALGQQCLYAASCATGSTNHNLSIMWEWGTADTSLGGSCAATPAPGNNCLEFGFVNSGPLWVFGTGQDVGSLEPGDATDIIGSFLGCSRSPALDITFGSVQTSTDELNRRYFSSCSNASAGLGLLKAVGGGHQPEGWDGLDAPNEMWTFWQDFPATG